MRSLPKALFISHGGGPMPLLDDPGHQEMVTCLKEITASFPKPDAIVVVSAHWEESVPTITSAANPSLIYDYYGFPPETYEVKYPCPGKPELASEIYESLSASGIEAKLDDSRGFDHGLFVPLTIMYPEADIPCIQLSLVNSLDAEVHVEMGRALQSLHKKNVLVLGSGFSFHNMKAFFLNKTANSKDLNESFEAWLIETCSSRDLPEQERTQRLIDWEEAKGARFCHPREEHLLPLQVCYGVVNTACSDVYELEILKVKSSMFAWS
ncbi:DODA-type extradiol aromatic ring-opening family dioxygenase [Leucothrix pacifica]|uniref:Dioxygenase n=1 Tax=Leucothrix pacifica TaxID=1247513 RepID=A0A317CHG7_9GAMM|nr:class III extradiol ring-cleavage dioxygenase [Leucothrix pacifica]PWQ97847.1 dioxygenase [Leucothrix pacifica]